MLATFVSKSVFKLPLVSYPINQPWIFHADSTQNKKGCCSYEQQAPLIRYV